MNHTLLKYESKGKKKKLLLPSCDIRQMLSKADMMGGRCRDVREEGTRGV